MIPTDPPGSLNGFSDFKDPFWNKTLTGILLLTAPFTILSIFSGLLIIMVTLSLLMPLLLGGFMVWSWWNSKGY